MKKQNIIQDIFLVAVLSAINCFLIVSNSSSSNSLRYDSLSDDCFVKQYNQQINRSSTSFKYYYFSNLVTNFGNNQIGSCGYVAMAMLLTYFDTAWDDNIVPENYEANSILTCYDVTTCSSSPGTNREANCPSECLPFIEEVGGIEVTNYSLYKSWLYNNYYNSSLHAKLIIDNTGSSPYSGPGVGPSTFGAAFSAYFNELNFNSYTYIRSPIGATSDQVKQWVIDQIENYDRPVILGRPGHVTVAYDYDIISDKVYVHNGWLGSTHAEFDSQFDDAHTLVFSGNHNHSNNYSYLDYYVCGCGFSFHNHDFTAGYSQYTNELHYKLCSCGYQETEPHDLVVIQLRPRLVVGCQKCGSVIMNGGVPNEEESI